MKPFGKLALFLLVWGASAATNLLAQVPRDRAVELTAAVQETPPTIMLQWNATAYTLLAQKVHRRLKDGPAWIELATPINTATSYLDSAVSPGVSYEYRVSRTFSDGPGVANGYISAGIRVPLVADRGKVILLVDDTMAAPLAPELTRFENDLAGDGWIVARQEIARTAAPPSVRAAVQSIYNANPASTVALILVGHIPVPYSGNYAMDGHPDHFGAWPTDVYYGDLDGTWTDTTVNNISASQDRNDNIPGDGKFNQTIIPSDIDLEVGRIDLADLPTFKLGDETSNATEVRLLRQYLDRDHRYRHKLAPFDDVAPRGLVDDHFGYFGGEAFAVTPWRSFTACVGAGNVFELDWFGTLQSEKYLWAYGCGGGSFTSAAGVGSTTDFASTPSLAVFNVLFGSYFGDWDATDSFLRAPLAGTAASLGLTSCWSGRPHWHFHPMALGETIGYAARLTQNNAGSASAGYESSFGARLNHIALLGDPTLRLYPVAPPSQLTATPAAQAVTLNWTAPGDGPIEGCILLRAASAAGPFVRLRNAMVTGTSYVDRSVTPGASYCYMVRAVRLETSPTGTYLNPSQGLVSTTVNASPASGPEIEIAGNGNPISAGDTTPLAVNGTEFSAIETASSVTRTFAITNAGATTLHLSNPAVTPNTADFTMVTTPPATLAAGASATFQIQFHPAATGPRSATFTLTSDDADEGTYAFALGGTGLPAHAEIAVYPPVIDRSIHVGDTVVETLHISDPGPGPLVHTISSSLARYSTRDSDSFGGPAFAWIDISTTGTEITGWANPDDAISDPIALGLTVGGNAAPFPFYGSAFTSARICTNGYLSFTDTSTNAGNAALPSSSGAANMVAPFWSDLLLVTGSHIFTKSTGGNFVVQFQDVGLYGNANGRVTCEAILLPSGEIAFQYQTLTQTGSNYTIGIQNGARTEGLPISFNTSYAHPGLAIRIRPPALESWLSLGENSGTVAPGGVQQIAATLNTAGLAPGNYYAELTVNSNAQGNASIVIPVRLTVGNTPSENWRLAHFGSAENTGAAADTADFDRDGRSNLLEYALLTDPGAPDPNLSPAQLMNATGYPEIQFLRDSTHTDLRIFVEATSDLAAGWTVIASSIHGAPFTATGAHSVSETGAGEAKTVTVEDTAPASTFPNRYLRLRVVRD